jgi:predicted ester cyclase
VCDNAAVVRRFVWTGTHRGEFLGVPQTGRGVSVWGMAIDRLVDGRIKETRILRTPWA